MSSKAYFDQIAQQWDTMQQSFFSEAVRDKALAVAGVQAGQLAADIGAGSGFLTEALLRKGLQVIAVDQSEVMVAEMRKKFGDSASVDYRLGQAELLPIPGESVDYVFANMYLHHVESPAEAIKEMVRLLKPEGKLVITDLDEHNFEFLREEQHDRWLGFKRLEIGDWFIGAGLKNVLVQDVGEKCCADSCCGGQSASVNIFVAVGEKEGEVAKTIKHRVKERYGAIADFHHQSAAAPIELMATRPQEASSCCGPSCCSPDDTTQTVTLAQALYNSTDLTGLPDSVTLASLGCGNPTAIAGLKPGETVLDLGSGGGIDCFIAAKFVGASGRVIGVDMTHSMLELANKNKAKLGLTNVEFRQGEIEALPVESDSVDVIISNCVINLSPDKDAVFREAFRVLKPGGRLAVSDIVTEGHFSDQLRANLSAWADCITGAIDQNEYLMKMRQAGFVDAEIEAHASYGSENLDLLDEACPELVEWASRENLTRNLDGSTVPGDVRVYSARIVARKPTL